MEWVAYPFSSGSSNPGIELGSPAMQAESLPTELSGKAYVQPTAWKWAESQQGGFRHSLRIPLEIICKVLSTWTLHPYIPWDSLPQVTSYLVMERGFYPESFQHLSLYFNLSRPPHP